LALRWEEMGQNYVILRFRSTQFSASLAHEIQNEEIASLASVDAVEKAEVSG
jgi:hypothetical protein